MVYVAIYRSILFKIYYFYRSFLNYVFELSILSNLLELLEELCLIDLSSIAPKHNQNTIKKSSYVCAN